MKVKLIGFELREVDDEFLSDIAHESAISLTPIIDIEPDEFDKFRKGQESKSNFSDYENPLQIIILSIKPDGKCNLEIHFKVAEVHPYIEGGEYTLSFDAGEPICMNVPKGMQVID